MRGNGGQVSPGRPGHGGPAPVPLGRLPGRLVARRPLHPVGLHRPGPRWLDRGPPRPGAVGLVARLGPAGPPRRGRVRAALVRPDPPGLPSTGSGTPRRGWARSSSSPVTARASAPSRSPADEAEGAGYGPLPEPRLARRRPDRRGRHRVSLQRERGQPLQRGLLPRRPGRPHRRAPALRGRSRDVVARRRAGPPPERRPPSRERHAPRSPSARLLDRFSPVERRDLLEAVVRLVAPRLGVRRQGERHLRGLVRGEPGRPARRGAPAGERRARDPRHRRGPEPRAFPARLREPGRARDVAPDRGGARRPGPRRPPHHLGPARPGHVRPPPERQRPGRARGRAHEGGVLGPRAASGQLHAERLLPLARRQRRQGRGALPLHRPQPDAGRRAGGRARARRPRRPRGPRGLAHGVRAHDLRAGVVRVGGKGRLRRGRPGRPLHRLHQRAALPGRGRQHAAGDRPALREPRRLPAGASACPRATVVRADCHGARVSSSRSPASPRTGSGTWSTSVSTGGSSAGEKGSEPVFVPETGPVRRARSRRGPPPRAARERPTRRPPRAAVRARLRPDGPEARGLGLRRQPHGGGRRAAGRGHPSPRRGVAEALRGPGPGAPDRSVGGRRSFGRAGERAPTREDRPANRDDSPAAPRGAAAAPGGRAGEGRAFAASCPSAQEPGT